MFCLWCGLSLFVLCSMFVCCVWLFGVCCGVSFIVRCVLIVIVWCWLNVVWCLLVVRRLCVVWCCVLLFSGVVFRFVVVVVKLMFVVFVVWCCVLCGARVLLCGC